MTIKPLFDLLRHNNCLGGCQKSRTKPQMLDQVREIQFFFFLDHHIAIFLCCVKLIHNVEEKNLFFFALFFFPIIKKAKQKKKSESSAYSKSGSHAEVYRCD